MNSKPSPAFVGASWVALGTGMIGYFIGLWRSDMQLNEKGYYFTTLMYGLFSVVSLQKAVRDRLENIPVTDLYHGLCWFSTILSIVLMSPLKSPTLRTQDLRPGPVMSSFGALHSRTSKRFIYPCGFAKSLVLFFSATFVSRIFFCTATAANMASKNANA